MFHQRLIFNLNIKFMILSQIEKKFDEFIYIYIDVKNFPNNLNQKRYFLIHLSKWSF